MSQPPIDLMALKDQWLAEIAALPNDRLEAVLTFVRSQFSIESCHSSR